MIEKAIAFLELYAKPVTVIHAERVALTELSLMRITGNGISKCGGHTISLRYLKDVHIWF